MGKFIPRIYRIGILIICIVFLFVSPSFSATKKDTKQAQQYRDSGYQAQRSGNLDMALSYYQRAIDTDPEYAIAYNDIGIILEAKGDFKKAKEAYLRAISLNPKFLSAYYNLAALYEKEGDFDSAAHYWKMRIRLGDWSDVWTWKAKEQLQALKISGQLKDSDISMAEDLSLGISPKRDAQYHLYQGRHLVATGDYVAAFDEFSKAVLLDPENSEAEQLLEETGRRVIVYK